MTCKEWREGYSVGFQDGYEKGKREGQTSPYVAPYPQQDWMKPKSWGTTCHVCGMFFEAGKAYGYACSYANCPSKAYCGTPLTTTGHSINTATYTTEIKPKY